MLTAQQSPFFSSIPVKLDRPILGGIPRLSQNPECLEDTDGAGAVIVRARCWQEREEIVGGVLVRAEDGQWRGEIADLGLEAGDDG